MNKIKKILRKVLPENIILYLWHYPRAVLAALFYGFPARKLIVIGVAGTKGKTTTCHLIANILETAGKKTAMVSTVAFKVNEKEELNPFRMTTLPSLFLQKFIKKAVESGCEYLVLEVTSHALIQHRTFSIPLKTVVLTNLMPDHLEYHKTGKNYQESHKRMITRDLQYLALNANDPNLENFFQMQLANGKKITYGLGLEQTINAQEILFSSDGTSFELNTPNGSIKIKTTLLGKFNLYNSLAAIAVTLYEKDIDLKTIKLALEKFLGTPGRMEKIEEGQNFDVIVDFAHSVDSLNSLFSAISLIKRGKIIVVFGACGERNPKPRPKMGEVVDQNADYIIVTNEDPYGEDPEKIISDLLAGIKNKTLEKNLWKILDRKLAIAKAFSLAQKDDMVLILGKGTEQLQIFKDRKNKWDDREVTKEALRELLKTKEQ